MSSPTLDTLHTNVARSSRACDACRLRKTRCGASVATGACTRCRRLKLQCTFEITPGRRGPKRKRGCDDVEPDPDTLRYEALPRSHSSLRSLRDTTPTAFPTDAICPRTLFRIILDDYLTSI
ncbi:uncharacterized protein EKO05_0006707 [Ascochyta rabiei]|uniref:uncharacterized protein n=1 Tax=Didymella rabiei TaxID=5454 RepID=UPI0022065102|nr:uncharacterized protein EKO05_0006707 [Ascochyta rabiei]UPX16298.1 hypothetical protein EKO05_0006707 [Ascochyta rabiei]